MLDILYPYCAGLDVHKKFVTVCRLILNEQGETQQEIREFSTMSDGLQALADWLSEGGVTHVAMESTGVYWQPIYNVLEERCTVFLINAQSIARMPGRKTDVQDAEWIATLLQRGLLQPSFIPERMQRELRELNRYRQSLIEERNRFANRLEKVLEGTNLKLSSVVTDIQGVSARAILQALLDGQTDPATLAELAKGRLRNKRAELERALQGQLRPQQRFLLAELLLQLDFLDEHLATVEAQIEEQLQQMPPFAEAAERLDTIPGIDHLTAIFILAEIGVDMARFPSADHLTAWAGVAPGNNETGGKQRHAKTRKGNRFLRRILVIAAHAAAHTRNTYLRALYYRLKGRREAGRAAMAVGRTILAIIYYMLKRGTTYIELGMDYFDRINKEQRIKSHVRRLRALGVKVTIQEQEQEIDPASSPLPAST